MQHYVISRIVVNLQQLFRPTRRLVISTVAAQLRSGEISLLHLTLLFMRFAHFTKLLAVGFHVVRSTIFHVDAVFASVFH